MDNRFQFDCPTCGKQRFYSHCSPWRRAQRNNTSCVQCAGIDDELCKRRSENAKGSKNHFSKDIYRGKANHFCGKQHTEETKTRLRQSLAERIRDKYGVSKDKGADNFFAYFNQCGFNFKEANYKKEIGYFADGYDESKHTWVEYDTDYHNRPYQKRKDLERQKRIIAYFEIIGKPLAQFLRYDVVKKKLHVAYRGKNWMKHLFGGN